MVWLVEPKRTWTEWMILRMLKIGPIPHHVAFIMDGNRRFAKQQEKKTIEGHFEGFRKLTEVLSWCRDLCIKEVTVYAFSIENFKRRKAEVDGLMKLAEEKFNQLLNELDKLKEHGVCIRVIGNTSLLSQKLQTLISKAVLATKDNDCCFLNLALSYTSRDEIVNAMNEIKTGIEKKMLKKSDISESLLENCLYTAGRKDPDLLIRTSGEIRLSEFLLWQSSFTHLFFTKVLWPQISIWHLYAAIFEYQRHHHELKRLKEEDLKRRLEEEEKEDSENMLNTTFVSHVDSRKQREALFLENLSNKRENYFREQASLPLN